MRAGRGVATYIAQYTERAAGSIETLSEERRDRVGQPTAPTQCPASHRASAVGTRHITEPGSDRSIFEQPRSARLPSRTLVHKFYPKAYSYHPSWFVLMSRPSLTCAIQSDIRCTVVLALSSGANVIRSGRLLSRRLLRRKRRCERALRRPEAARTQPETGSASLGRPTAPCWPRAADDQLRR